MARRYSEVEIDGVIPVVLKSGERALAAGWDWTTPSFYTYGPGALPEHPAHRDWIEHGRWPSDTTK